MPTGIGINDINDPYISQWMRDSIASSPQLLALMRSGGSGQIDVGNTKYTVTNGYITHQNTGSFWKPVLAAVGVAATGGLAAGAFSGAGGAMVGSTGTVGSTVGTVGTVSAVGDLLLKYGLPAAGKVADDLIQANATGHATAAELKYYEEALAWQKEQDLYNRGVAAAAVTKEAGRYGDYQGRIKGFVDNGQTSNDRMSALLGLPARPASSSGGGGAGPSGVAMSPEIAAAVAAEYKRLGVAPTGRGTGATDSAYYGDQVAGTGGLTPEGTGYWFGAGGRIASDLAKQGGARPVTPAAAGMNITSQPITSQARSAEPMVTMRSPDGVTKQIPQSQAAHYVSLGATVIGTAA